MCLLKVKEELGYSVPARRTTNYRRSRGYSTSPPRVARVSTTRFVEERRPSGYIIQPAEPPAPSPLPPPPPTSLMHAHSAPVPPPPPPAPSTHYSATRIESRHSQSEHAPRSPSIDHSTTKIEQSRRTSRAPSVHSRATEPQYVEVEHDRSSRSSSPSRFSEDVRSRSTHKTTNTHKSFKSKTTPPRSEYSIHEKETIRDRSWSSPKSGSETHRSVNAPTSYSRSQSRRGDSEDPRASRASYGRKRESYVIEEDYPGTRSDFRT